MVAAGAPSSSPIKKPSGSAAAKQASSARPGFQPSAAAHFTANEISSGRIVRMLRPLMAGDRADGLMNRTTASELYRQKLDRYGGASPFQPLASQVWTPMATYMDLNPHLWAKIGRETDCCDIAPQRSAVSW